MRDVNIRLCGNLWQNLGDQQAGWELIRCLRSSDPQVRDAAQEYLVEAGPRSITLLQAAIASGALEGATAVECMVTLLDFMALEDTPEEADLRYDC
jgi:HEAT repeat protein